MSPRQGGPRGFESRCAARQHLMRQRAAGWNRGASKGDRAQSSPAQRPPENDPKTSPTEPHTAQAREHRAAGLRHLALNRSRRSAERGPAADRAPSPALQRGGPRNMEPCCQTSHLAERQQRVGLRMCDGRGSHATRPPLALRDTDISRGVSRAPPARAMALAGISHVEGDPGRSRWCGRPGSTRPEEVAVAHAKSVPKRRSIARSGAVSAPAEAVARSRGSTRSSRCPIGHEQGTRLLGELHAGQVQSAPAAGERRTARRQRRRGGAEPAAAKRTAARARR